MSLYRTGVLGVVAASIGLAVGCRESPSPEPTTRAAKPAAARSKERSQVPERSEGPGSAGSHALRSPGRATENPSSRPDAAPGRSARSKTPESEGRGSTESHALRPSARGTAVDDARAAAAGLRKLSGKRLMLYTDLPPGPEIDNLPEVFDQAFSQWCEFFEVDPAEHADWRLLGFLAKEKTPFEKAGAWPDDLPPFKHGYSRGLTFWLYDQPSDYYRRHLALHEGTHCFMDTLLGGCGPPWYMEGMAELLATHRWRDGRLALGYFPKSSDEVPMLGRVKFIKDGFTAGRARSLQAVLDYGPHAHLDTEPYAWCWALCALLDGDPRFHERFRQLPREVRQPDFTGRFLQALGTDRTVLARQWQVFVADLEYGYDVARSAIDFAPGRPLSAGGAKFEVAADRGWQNSALRLEAGRSYRLRAAGRYQVAGVPRPWWCEPGGVTIRYYQGRPLGILLAAVQPDAPADGPVAFLHPTVVGLETTITPPVSGTLYFKINDSAAELGDNQGTATVEVSPTATPD